MLDLRQPCRKDDINNYDCYRYGWIDVPEKMLFAMFNLLDQFIKHEIKNLYCPSEEDIIKEPGLQSQRDLYFEILAIHKWWFEERLDLIKNKDKRLHEWCEARKDKEKRQNGECDTLFKNMQKHEEDLETKLDEVISRLMKIRRSLWT
jgi:hypothetical protein